MSDEDLRRRLDNQKTTIQALLADNESLRERLDLAIRKLDRIADVVTTARARCATPIAPPSTKLMPPSTKSSEPPIAREE